ncbi:MAG: hypothetical protein K2M31_02235 [Muribaculaceae bacterium]|nr:hypothetical protein [Muribaculaceae bacterium]
MKKIYATLAAMALCAATASAAITVSVDGKSIPNNGTVTVTAADFNHTYFPPILDQWKGATHIEVESAAPTNVDLLASSGDIMFCPVGGNCYNTFPAGDGTFTGNGVITENKATVEVDMNYYDAGENLPQEVQTLKATFTDKSGDTFVLNFVFDTNDDSGVDGIAADGLVNVYSISGLKVLDAAPAEALSTLPKGLYIVNGKKVAVK